MGNDTYGASADFNEHYVDAGPPRTSVLAILSLVCSLICFIPGLSAIGSLFGVFALLGISASKGRVKGTGLAIAGIAVGVIVSLLWIGSAIAIQQGAKQYLKMTDVFVDIDSGSYDSARGYLSSSTRPLATDDAFEAFKATYMDDAGQYQGSPEGIWQLIKTFGTLGQSQDPNAVQKTYGRDQAPVPALFQNGPRWIFVAIDQSEGNDAGTFRALTNVGYWHSDGSLKWLVDPDALRAGGAAPAASESDEDSQDAPAEEPPADTGG